MSERSGGRAPLLLALAALSFGCDKWCVCALRWKEAFDAGCAPEVILEATHEKSLDYVNLDDLISMSSDTKYKERS